MTFDRSKDFDIKALFTALDLQRHERGLSWQQTAREINAQVDNDLPRQISASTISGMLAKRVIEGDGVLQMLRWLNRTPESFMPDYSEAEADETRLPQVPLRKVLRFDAKAIYAAMDAERAGRAITWKQVADEIGGMNAPSLTRLADGGRVGFPDVMRIFRWLGRTAASFTRITDW